MSRSQQVARPIVRSLQQGRTATTCQSRSIAARQFSSTTSRKDEITRAEPLKLSDIPISPQWTPEQLAKLTSPDLGSRRRRAALATTTHVPFEQMPYQCFQEARKVLNEDRQEKIAQIVAETEKIKRLEAADPSTMRGGEAYKEKRLASLRKHVEELKILADINDPSVKRRFEDGMGDMSKPVYRYLANRRWRAMDHKIIVQRIDQFHIVPDILPKFEPTVDVKMSFRGQVVSPGQFLDSRVTELAPTLRMQVFDKGGRLISVVVMDSDVPDTESDLFTRRCHYLATNIPWDPTKTQLPLRLVGSPSGKTGGELAVPWLPAFAQKGSPYHRMSVFILEQKAGEKLDATKLQELYDGPGRDAFTLKSFRDKFNLTPVGFNLFRTEWDENTADVMARHAIPGADIEFRHQHFKTLKTPRAAKGWEAKRQKPKFKSLWKYTKRIATL
ncbi:phosphatidylethanolamine-binding protein [Lasiosphaeria hispida]|uniref:Large ribosomal subunit protein mL38 n=1 Tax=Lasiosphaeria hispida TaxID=260671 RepID=A0AAJ0HQ77_9PEZI|nr:phosphatidylethanolamine-binding protein [Lasiosphaeria hispida]